MSLNQITTGDEQIRIPARRSDRHVASLRTALAATVLTLIAGCGGATVSSSITIRCANGKVIHRENVKKGNNVSLHDSASTSECDD